MRCNHFGTAVALVLATASLQACASSGKKLPPPLLISASGVRLGINAGWHGPVDDAAIAHLCAVHVRTIRSAISDVAQAPSMVSQAAKCPGLAVQFLIEDDNLTLARALSSWLVMMAPANVTAVEFGNERNYAATPEAFGLFVRQAADLFDAWPGDLISGGISDVRPKTLQWLHTAMVVGQWPRRVKLGIHRYAQGDGTPASPQDGYADRIAETNAIKATADGRDVSVTETGYVFDGLDSDETIATELRDDVAWFAQLKPDVAPTDPPQPVDVLVYQLVNGPTTKPIDHFGWMNSAQMFRPSIDAVFAGGGR